MPLQVIHEAPTRALTLGLSQATLGHTLLGGCRRPREALPEAWIVTRGVRVQGLMRLVLGLVLGLLEQGTLFPILPEAPMLVPTLVLSQGPMRIAPGLTQERLLLGQRKTPSAHPQAPSRESLVVLLRAGAALLVQPSELGRPPLRLAHPEPLEAPLGAQTQALAFLVHVLGLPKGYLVGADH